MRFICFDLETSGVDPGEDRIVTAFLGLMNADTGQFELSGHWLVNPGRDIPAGATAVHGISTEHARKNGVHPSTALEQIHAIITAECGGNGLPLVIFNAPFDATMLNAELVRNGYEPFEFGLGGIHVIDPLVIDRHLYRYRKGSGMRKLTAICPIYGVPVEENAHDAGADCLMTGRVALRQLSHLLQTGYTLERLQTAQAKWHEESANSLQAYFNKNKPGEIVSHGWPVRIEQEEKVAA